MHFLAPKWCQGWSLVTAPKRGGRLPRQESSEVYKKAKVQNVHTVYIVHSVYTVHSEQFTKNKEVHNPENSAKGAAAQKSGHQIFYEENNP